jgi:hypothetical protein
LILGRYLLPTDPGVDWTMSAKLLKANGEELRCNTFSLLQPEEFDTEGNKRMRNEFYESVAKRLRQAIENENLLLQHYKFLQPRQSTKDMKANAMYLSSPLS